MDTPMRTTGFNTNSSSDSGSSRGTAACSHCGQSFHRSSRGMDQFLGMLGISEEMVDNLKGSFENVNLDQYVDTAREYLKAGGEKATSYARKNPAKVAAGVAILAVGAGLMITALSRD